ncbi:glycoside hydrolase family 66 protein [Prevotella melaninogenica]|uniref:Cycloisomaltooligosaccharide glucanotransferase n=1 Tax=Prevotella melaninogenica TaxID=28132 RepID=A0A250KKB2_9BACT|nr:glycoside hydrolase family 66 protein [Prevotella melaninogenica]BBA28223.1 cycloisomaltooligosaccharide glucanotransferase [Prevotella melaninogenica]
MRLKRFLILWVTLSSAAFSFADDFVYDNLKYATNSDNSVTLVDGKGASGEIIIPSEVRNNKNVYTVTAIEHNAFERNNAITAVTIPSSVSTIGYSAFNGCKGLRRVMDASRVTEMQGFEYTDCTNLTSVTLSGTLQKIGYRSFAGSALAHLVLPASMREIGSSAFEDCHQLRNVQFNTGLQNIKDHAFKNSGLVSLEFSNDLKEIGEWAFEGCASLKTVQIPPSVTSLGMGAFYHCIALESVVIPTTLTNFNDRTFNGCRNLSAVYYLGSSCPSLGQYTFADVSGTFGFYVKPSALSALQGIAFISDKVKDSFPYQQSSKYTTFSRSFDIDFTTATGLKAYIAKESNGRTSVSLIPITTASAGTGLIIEAVPNTVYQLRLADNAAHYDDNALRVSTGETISTTTLKLREDITSRYAPVELTTDKVRYEPESTVRFTSKYLLPDNVKVRYLHGNTVVKTDEIGGKQSWSWKVPAQNFTGYLAEIYVADGIAEQTLATIGVDVSTEWGRFPRYGFISHYGSDKTVEQVKKEVDMLNRYHMTGIQFYDWQWQHHKLIPEGASQWKDVGLRDVFKSSIENYITKLHEVGSKCMFYDLLYGVTGNIVDGKPETPANLDGKDGVSSDWGWIDLHANDKDGYDLHQVQYPLGSWPSIYVMNPGNQDWVNYLSKEIKKVYQHLKFDGYHIDQLGRQREAYYTNLQSKTEDGQKVYTGGDRRDTHDFEGYYANFINRMKSDSKDKSLVMNAVSTFGGPKIVGTGNVEFGYNEMWGADDYLWNYRKIIQDNRRNNGKNTFNTVFAAYLHCRNGNGGQFRTSSALFGNATIFALGGSRIELSGDHMLFTEYFPDDARKMSDKLQKSIIHYYDFLVAYENYLRDGNAETSVNMTMDGVNVVAWDLSDPNPSVADAADQTIGPKPYSVNTYSTMKGNVTAIQLLNYSNFSRDNFNIRDIKETMPEPNVLLNKKIVLDDAAPVARIWVASPDCFGGAPQEVVFTQNNGKVTFTLPSLEYWTMVVVEHGSKVDNSTGEVRNYILRGESFIEASNNTVPAGEAYLSFPANIGKTLQPLLPLVPVTAGITNVTDNGRDDYYTVSGIKVDKPVKGVYIHKGKKLISK